MLVLNSWSLDSSNVGAMKCKKCYFYQDDLCNLIIFMLPEERLFYMTS